MRPFMRSINTKGGEKMKMIIAAALLPIGLVLGTSLLISLVSRLVARLRKTEHGDDNSL